MKYKIIDTYSRHVLKKENSETVKQFVVKIQTPIGVFEGVSTLHPEDVEHERRFYGYEIAEKKAYIKALKKRARQLTKEQGEAAAYNTNREIGICTLNLYAFIKSTDIILDKIKK